MRAETDSAALPDQVWAVEITPSVARRLTSRRLIRMRLGGVNTIVLTRRVRGRLAENVRSRASRFGFLVISAPRSQSPGGAPACGARDARQGGLCVVSARSLAAASAAAARDDVDIVIVHLKRARDVARAARASPSGRILVSPPFRNSRNNRSQWRAAIAAATNSSSVDVGPRLVPARATALDSYVKLLTGQYSKSVASAGGRRDEPSNLIVTRATQTSISVAWQQPPRGATSYGVYVNGRLALSTASTSATVGGLTCSSSYTIEVDAVSKNRRSARVGITGTTSACPAPPGGDASPPADTQPPSSPASVSVTAATATSVTVAWAASSDNVGVSGYGVFVGGARRGATTATSYTFSSLTCGTAYTFGVDAYDAAGNHSAVATVAGVTAACPPAPDTTPPSAPGALTRAGATQTSITVGWSPSTDNVAVTGYWVYANGNLSGTTTATNYVVSGLACGTTTTIAVEARDAAGNASARASIAAATAACTVPDTTPPPKPTGLTMTGATETTITLAWNPTTDNVGVAGHNLYRNGSVVGTTGATTYTYTYTGLSCGTSYTLALEVFDAAGNRSLKEEATTIRSTLACASPLPPPPPPPGGTLYVSPSGSDSNACALSAPCASFDRAYHVAQPSNVVEVLAGTYAAQSMTADSSKTSGAVVFRPAAGASVTIDRLYVEGSSYLTFSGLRFNGRVVVENTDPGSAGSTDVAFENIEAQTLRFVGRVRNITVRGGSFGNTVDNQPQIKKYNPYDSDASRPHNILIDGAYFHDFRRSGPSIHTECLQLIHSSAVTIRKSRFNNCDGTGDIGVTDGPHDNLTIENNFLGRDGDAYFAVQMTKNVRNLVFRYNSASKGVIFSDSDSGGPYSFVGNYMPFNASTCSSGVTYSYNVFAGGTCGATDRNVASLRFVNVDAFDLHLASGSEAIDAGDPANFPSTDLDGNGRSGRPDAGADEH